MVNRDAIYQAFAALLTSKLTTGSTPPVKTVNQFFQGIKNLGPDKFPAIMMVPEKEPDKHSGDDPSIEWLKFNLYVYLEKDGVANSTAEKKLSPVLDAIDTAIGPDPVTGRGPNLGGLVRRIRREGTTTINTGGIGTQTAFALPILCMVTQ
jgi:hypothetical protein